MSLASHKPILIVEDNDEDFEATIWALRKASVEIPVIRCKDGEQALDYLEARAHSGHQALPSPALVLLDLNLPRSNGQDLLKHIKTSHELRSLPIIVITTSANQGDVKACYRLGANSYVVKPVDITHLLELVKGLIDYWFRLVLLPQSEDTHGH